MAQRRSAAVIRSTKAVTTARRAVLATGRAVKIATVVVALAAGATTWAIAKSPAPSESATKAPTVDPTHLSRRLPFHPLIYASTEAEVQIRLAESQLTIACMARAGFRYEPGRISGVGDLTDVRRKPFGLETLTPAGYAGPEEAPSEVPKSEAFIFALYGRSDDRIAAQGKILKVSRPANGCLAEAERQMLGTERMRWLQLQIQLGEGEMQAREQLEQDSVFRAANQRWRQCMREAGFEQRDPVSLLRSIPQGTKLTTHAAARTDVRCKSDTDYLITAYSRLQTAQQAWLDQHVSALNAWKSLLREQSAAAERVLHWK